MKNIESNKREMKVLESAPLDFFNLHTLTFLQWIKKNVAESKNAEIECWLDFIEACAMFREHAGADADDLCCVPHVGYNQELDCEYFIFKVSNNGTTFLIGRALPSSGRM